MKKILFIALSTFILTACGDDKPTDPNAPTQNDKNKLELAFLNNMTIPSGSAISCQTEKVGDRYYTGCALVSVGKRGNTYLFLYNKDKDPVKRYYALNGSAMSKYDAYFKSEPTLGNYSETFGLPMEKDIDLNAVLKAFEK